MFLFIEPKNQNAVFSTCINSKMLPFNQPMNPTQTPDGLVSESAAKAAQAKVRFSLQVISKLFEPLNVMVVQYRFLAQGNHNENFLVETTAGSFVLRIELGHQFKNLKNEYETLINLPAGLGPKVFVFDDSHTTIDHDYLIEEFISGEHPADATDEFIKEMAHWFKQLHAIKRETTEPFLASAALEPYHRNVQKFYARAPKDLTDNLTELLDQVQTLIKQYDSLFLSEKTESLLHRDASQGNILFNEKTVRLIDWEFSNYGPAEWDLVYFIQSFHLTPDQQEDLLREYDYSSNAEDKKRLKAIELLDLSSAIGYSLWRLDLMAIGEVSKDEELKTQERLRQDVTSLKALLAA